MNEAAGWSAHMPVDTEDAVRLGIDFLKLAGFSYAKILKSEIDEKTDVITLEVYVGFTRQRIGKVLLDARSGRVIRHEVDPL